MIRIPDVPGLNGQQVNMPQERLGAATAPTAALGHVAQAIAGVGKHFQAVADQAQQLENARAESEARMKLAGGYADLQLELEKDPDPASRIEKTKQFFAQTKGVADDPNLSPLVRDRLRVHHDEFASHGMIRAGAEAAQLLQKRTLLQADNEISSAIDNGDGSGAHAALDRIAAIGAMLPEEVTAHRQKIDHALLLRGDQAAITHDPADWLKNHPADTIPKGYDPVSWQNQQSFARGQLRTRTYDATANIQDGIVSGKITTPEQIDGLTQDLRPAAVDELKQALAQRAMAGYKDKVASPEYQAQTVGKVSAMLADYKPDGEGFDTAFVQMDSLTRTLPPGAVRDELERKIRQVRDEKPGEVKTHADAADKALDEAYKAGLFGAKTVASEPIPVSRIINDGFLGDRAKLKGLGLTDEQVKAVADAEPKNGNQTKNEARKAAFLGLSPVWGSRQNVTADDLTKSAAEAILNGETQLKYSSPGAANEAAAAAMNTEMRYGKAKTDFAEWRKLNPDATSKEIEDKVFTLAGALPRENLSSGIYDPKPSRYSDLPPTSSNRNYSVGDGNVVTNETQVQVQANAKPYLKDPAADLTKAPLGMRNNNPTNIIYPSEKVAKRFGAIGKSSNQDAGSTDGHGGKYSQMVFATPEDGMNAGARLARSKYNGGMTTATELITSSNGWTPGNHEAAANIARGMGLGPNDDLNLDDPKFMARFLKALVIQEHGKAGNLYKDSLFAKAAEAVSKS